MGISLSKGGNVSLAKVAPGLLRIGIGLGWDARSTDGAPFDLDASAFLLTAAEKVRNAQDFVFYNQPRSPEGAVEYTGDNRTGDGAGDDESVFVEVGQVPADVQKISVCVSIDEAGSRGQNFGMVRGAFIRIYNRESGEEVARYDLSEDASTESAMIFGELYRHQGEWKFRAVGQGFQGGLAALAQHYGVSVS